MLRFICMFVCYCINNVYIQISVHTTRFWNNRQKVRLETNNLKVLNRMAKIS